MGSQKKIFLEGEGDSWFSRNKEAISKRVSYPELEILFPYIVGKNMSNLKEDFRFLEIGCGGGDRTNFLQHITQRSGIGIDSSSHAIQFATQKYQNTDLTFLVATADDLPLQEESVDLIYFGFCLYLVDRSLLNKCIEESLRVLRTHGKLLLLDFDPDEPSSVPYRHDPGISTYKDNYEKYFVERGFRIVAKLSQCESGEIGFEQDSYKRVATFLLSK